VVGRKLKPRRQPGLFAFVRSWELRALSVRSGVAAAADIDFVPASTVFGTSQEAPGFAVDLEAGHAAATGWEDLHRADPGEEGDGEHVPDVVGDHVSDDEVDVARGVAAAVDVATGVEGVSVDGAGVGGLDLDAPGAGTGVDDEVVAVAFAPRFGDGEAEGGGFEEEGGFCDLPAALRGEPEVPRLRSGFRHAAQTPRERLNFGDLPAALGGERVVG